MQLVRHWKQATNPIGCAFLFLGTPILEAVGFGIRVPSLLSPSNEGLYLGNMIILGLGPLYFAAVNWFVLCALIVWAGLQYSIIKPRVLVILTFIFLISIIQLNVRGLCYFCVPHLLIIGLAQGYNYTETKDTQNGGSGVMLGGLGFILGMSLAYIILFAIFLASYFSDAAIPASDAKHRRVRTISIVLSINFCAVMVT